MRSRRRSLGIPFGIFGVVTIAILVAVWILPSNARGATKHRHPKAEILPPGTINGQSNPEAISEPVAWGLLFRTLQSLSQDPQRAIAYQSYLNLMKLDPADQDGPGPRESEQVAFRRVVDRFATQVSQVDLEVARVKAVWRTTGRRQRDPFAERQIEALEVRRKTILSTVVADLPRDIGIHAAGKVRTFMLHRVRRHSELLPKGVVR